MTNTEKVLQMLHANANLVLQHYTEPLAVMYAVAWQPVLGNDLPFGAVVQPQDIDDRQGSEKRDLWLSCMTQASKLSVYLAHQYENKVKSTQEILRTQNKQIASLLEQVRDLKNAKTQEAPGPTDPSGPG